MTDREILLFAYGALKALSEENANLATIVTMIESHFWPAVQSQPEPPKDEDVPF